MIGPESKIRRQAEVQGRALEEGEGGVLLHLTSGQYHGVNPVGWVIWELIEEERTVTDLASALRDRLDDPPGDLESDVVGFLAGIQERDLIVVE